MGLGLVRSGKDFTAGHGKVMFSEVWWCMVWHGLHGVAGRSRVRCSAVRYGHAWRGFRGEAGRGVVQPGLVS